MKTENGTVAARSSAPPSTGQVQSTEPVSEEEIRAVIAQRTPITTQELVAKFKARLKTSEVIFSRIIVPSSLVTNTNIIARYHKV